MLTEFNSQDKFTDYYEQWIKVYKEGAVREVTMEKYRMSLTWLKQLTPELTMAEMNRITYQSLLNSYAESHERQTTMDFHHQIKGAVLDAVDEGLIPRDPTRKVIIKGKAPRDKKPKYLNQFEMHTLLSNLNLGEEVNWDWLILLIAKTGLRYAEALAVTPGDFDFAQQTLTISKTWNYKGEGGFQPTKTRASMRKIKIDWRLVTQFATLCQGREKEEPLFVEKKEKYKAVYNSTANSVLERHCRKLGLPVVSVHGLRHTHASLLLYAGVSIASVARRLGHSDMSITEKIYLHVIQELENQDVDLVMRSLANLT